jgi:predicted nucleic acid-binding protein
MIVIDTSVWADHFRKAEAAVTDIGRSGELRMHPFVVGELAAGNLPDWNRTVAALRLIPAAATVEENILFQFMADHGLMGSGLSFVDIHLLASVAIAESAQLWSRDKRLKARAEMLGIAHRAD